MSATAKVADSADDVTATAAEEQLGDTVEAAHICDGGDGALEQVDRRGRTCQSDVATMP